MGGRGAGEMGREDSGEFVDDATSPSEGVARHLAFKCPSLCAARTSSTDEFSGDWGGVGTEVMAIFCGCGLRPNRLSKESLER